MELISGEEQIYGYRKLAKCLLIQHKLVINKKKVYRLCKDLGILKKTAATCSKTSAPIGPQPYNNECQPIVGSRSKIRLYRR